MIRKEEPAGDLPVHSRQPVDCFALLGVARAPWLDEAGLKETFLQLSVELHPDRAQRGAESERQARHETFLELQNAYNTLHDPRTRLRHLLELEQGRKPKEIESIPDDMVELFLKVGNECREVDAFLREKNAARSPMLRAALFERTQDWKDSLGKCIEIIQDRLNRLTNRMREMNRDWESAAPPGTPARQEALPCDALEEIYRDLAYLIRWQEQIRERNLQLSL